MFKGLDAGPPASLLLKTLLESDDKHVLDEDLPGIVIKQHLYISWVLPDSELLADDSGNWLNLNVMVGDALLAMHNSLKPWAAVRFEPIDIPECVPSIPAKVWDSDNVRLRLVAHYSVRRQYTMLTLDCFVRCFLWGPED